MSSFIYPTLPGLTLEQVRKYEWKTLTSEADSGVMTTVARRKYPIIHWEHTYEVLRRYTASDELQQIVGLYNSLQGQYDTFLFTDPEFNTITFANMAQYGLFGVGTGSQTVYQLTVTFETSGGPGGAEIVQNLNGTPSLYTNRYLNELMSPVSRTNYLLQSNALATSPWSPTNATMANNVAEAPDGNNTATSLTETTANGTHSVNQAATVPSSVETFTLTAYVKASNRYGCAMVLQENTSLTSSFVYFNLSGVGPPAATVITGSNWSNVSGTITPANVNFYRCTITATKTNAATSVSGFIVAASADGTVSYVGNTSAALYIWGAQLEIGTLGSTMYLPTTTSTVTQLDYTLGATGLVTFTNAPVNTAQLLWAGSWYYRCRFEEDAIVWTKFMNQLWKAQVKFRQVKI